MSKDAQEPAVEDQDFDAGFANVAISAKPEDTPSEEGASPPAGEAEPAAAVATPAPEAPPAVEAEPTEPTEPAPDEPVAPVVADPVDPEPSDEAALARKADERAQELALEQEQDARDQLLTGLEDEFPDVRVTLDSPEWVAFVNGLTTTDYQLAASGRDVDARAILRKYQAASAPVAPRGTDEDSPATAEPAPAPPQSAAVSPADLQDLDVVLPDGSTVKMSEIEKEMGPEYLAGMLAVIQRVQGNGSGGPGNRQALDLEEMKSVVSDMKFNDVLQEAHPDARDIRKSPEFAGWLAKQSERLQGLNEGRDVEGITLLLDAYKQSAVGQTAAGQAVATQRHRDLHGGSLRGGGGEASPADHAGEGDFGDGFQAVAAKRK